VSDDGLVKVGSGSKATHGRKSVWVFRLGGVVVGRNASSTRGERRSASPGRVANRRRRKGSYKSNSPTTTEGKSEGKGAVEAGNVGPTEPTFEPLATPTPGDCGRSKTLAPCAQNSRSLEYLSTSASISPRKRGGDREYRVERAQRQRGGILEEGLVEQ